MAARCGKQNIVEGCEDAMTSIPVSTRWLSSVDKITIGMHAVRTGYRQEQDARMKALEAENAALKAENAALKQRIAELEKKNF